VQKTYGLTDVIVGSNNAEAVNFALADLRFQVRVLAVESLELLVDIGHFLGEHAFALADGVDIGDQDVYFAAL
jgi:hypothetical protein